MAANWQLIYTVLALAAAIVAAGMAVLGWQRRSASGARTFTALMIALSIWSIAYALEFASDNGTFIITFHKLAYLGIVNVPVFWFMFALAYTGGKQHLTRRNVALLFIIPAITLASAWSNELHHLHWSALSFKRIQGFTVLDITLGPTFWMFIIYAYLLMLAATVILLRVVVRSRYLYQQQAIALVVSAAIPWLASLLTVFNLRSLIMDLTPLSLTLAGVVMAWGMLRLQVLEDVPVARDAVIEGMDDGVIVFNSQNRVIDANSAAGRLIGMSVREMLGKSPEYIFRDHPEVLEIHKDLLKLDEDANLRDEAVLGRGKSRRFVEMSVSHLKNGESHPTGHMTLLMDITSRKEAQISAARRLAEMVTLRHVDDRINSTLDINDVLRIALTSASRLSNADAGFVSLIDEDGEQQRIVHVTGKYPQDYVGRTYPLDVGIVGRVIRSAQAELVHDVSSDPDYQADLPDTRAEMAIPLLSADRLVGVLTLETENPDNFNPELFEFAKLLAGRIGVAVENARLYTVSQQQLGELQHLYNQVSELEQLKTDIIRIASHDLLNPVATTMGFLDLLDSDRDRLDPDHREFVDMMIRQIQRMHSIVTDILSLERIQQGSVREPLDMSLLVSETVANFDGDTQRKNQMLRVTVPDEPLVIEGDSAQLREALTNLLTNAIKYTPQGGEVSVHLQQADGKAVLEVTDTGYGVPEDQQAEIWEPGVRASMVETVDIEGTGWGLPLVKKIIERHDGVIRFHSAYGQGSTFGFELPLSVTSPTETEQMQSY